MTSTKLSFPNAEGVTLSARLDSPVDRPAATALFAHCFTCSKDLRAATAISRALTDRGYAVLRFDFTGLGESDGEFADTNFSSNVADLVAAALFLEEKIEAPQLLVGHSLGGTAVLMAAAQIPSSKAVATLGAPCDPEHVAHLVDSSREEIERTGQAEVRLGGRPFTIKKQFLDDLAKQSMIDTLRDLRRALLVMHSPIDAIVGVENAAHIFQNALHPKSFVSLDAADHLLSEVRDAEYAASVIAAWADRYVERREPSALDAEGHPVAVRTGSEGFRTEILAGRHRLVADEPASVGGGDAGPTPYDYLAAALGTCTAMTIQMVAKRKQWPLEQAIVRLTHDKVHSRDCEECEEPTAKIDRFQRELELVGDLDAEQRQRLLEIADKCPVHRTLHAEIVVETTLKP